MNSWSSVSGRSEEGIYEFWRWDTSCPISLSLYLQYSPPTLQLSITSLLIRNDETISLQCPDFFQWIKLPSYNIDFREQHTSFSMELHSRSFVNMFQIKSFSQDDFIASIESNDMILTNIFYFLVLSGWLIKVDSKYTSLTRSLSS